MRISRPFDSPTREVGSWQERWEGPDLGLIACWERGRDKALESPELALQARQGRLVSLPFKGGVDKRTKKAHKIGTFFYLAMWQGLRGEDLDIALDRDTDLICSWSGTRVTFTKDFVRYSNA